MKVHLKKGTSAEFFVVMLLKISDENLPTTDSFMSHGPELILSVI